MATRGATLMRGSIVEAIFMMAMTVSSGIGQSASPELQMIF
jgi:hypothetical protein